MNEFTVQELVFLKNAMQDRMATRERLINELGEDIASKILLDNYRCLHLKILELLKRRINELDQNDLFPHNKAGFKHGENSGNS